MALHSDLNAMFNPQTTTQALSNSLLFGTVIAVVISWDRNKSILLAILHGMLSWIYVIHVAISRERSKNGSNVIAVVVYGGAVIVLAIYFLLFLYHR